MSDRPILFSAPMVRALLDGRKTQTRRILKPQPPSYQHYGKDIMDWGLSGIYHDEENTSPHKWWLDVQTDADDNSHQEIDVRFANGDRLWVRETLIRAPESGEWFYAADQAPIGFPASDPRVPSMIAWAHHKEGNICVSIHMPRWASRLTLTVTDVRVQRLQEISNEDCIAEGVPIHGNVHAPRTGPAIDEFARKHGLISHYGDAYRRIWTEINGAGSWNINPWVVAVSFTVERHNIDWRAT
jgi:hypothetical protein